MKQYFRDLQIEFFTTFRGYITQRYYRTAGRTAHAGMLGFCMHQISSPISRSRLSSINTLFLVGLSQNIQDFPGGIPFRVPVLTEEDTFCLKCSMTIVLSESQD